MFPININFHNKILTNDNEEGHFDDFHFRTWDDTPWALAMQRYIKDIICRATPRTSIPNLFNDESIAAGNNGDGYEEEEDGDEGHIKLPMPLLVKLNPALQASLDLNDFIEKKLRKWENRTDNPRAEQQPACTLWEAHGLHDGTKSVDAERHQNIIWSVWHEALKELD